MNATSFGIETSPERPRDMERSQASSSGVGPLGQTCKSVGTGKKYGFNDNEDVSPQAQREREDIDKNKDKHEQEENERHPMPLSADPDSYLHAKRRLKKAVLEHYR